MCGIVGYIGQKEKTMNVLLNGLERLEYRGYDSTGIAYFHKNNVEILKKTGKLNQLKNVVNKNIQSEIGIGHTRWATHGKPSELNAHPHCCGKITEVHNGINENMNSLKKKLQDEGISFISDTDTEVLVALLNYEYEHTNHMVTAMERTMSQIIGSYAVVFINEDDKDCLYVMKKDSPLLLGIGNQETYIASDMSAFCEFTNQYCILDDEEYGVVEKNHYHIYKYGKEIKKDIEKIEGLSCLSNKEAYDCYMHKEIYDIPKILKELFTFYEDEHSHLIPDYKKYHKIQIVACGSAYHAGMIGKCLFEQFANFPVEVEYASEYRYKTIFADENTLVIFVSQSGETADTIACAKKIKSMGVDSLAIVNVYNSTLSRLTNYVYYMKAGEERAVATTKGYSSQVAIFVILLREWMKQQKTWSKELEAMYQDGKEKLLKVITPCLKQYEHFSWISNLINQPSNFFIGRRSDYALSMEASLKLKEVSYLNSSAYAAGELKHGTISLIEEKTPVFAIATDEYTYSKTKSNLMEVKARGGYVILATLDTLDDSIDVDEKIIIPDVNPLFQSIMTILPFQLLSYHVAKKLKLDIDHPRNLAKSVTVE